MSAKRHLTRGLRFRLTAGYALLFALLLVGTAALFRERLAYTLNSEAHDLLEQEWVAMKGYLHIERRPSMATRRRAASGDWCATGSTIRTIPTKTSPWSGCGASTC